MFESLISGFRIIRVSFITGAIIVIAFYILLYDHLFSRVSIRPYVAEIFKLLNIAPLVFFIILSLIIGSLYTTFLEGIVDGLHRKHVNTSYNSKKNKFKNGIINALLPYSESAKNRLQQESIRFFKEFSATTTEEYNQRESLFTKSVFIETLWMEGKIAGTSLEQPYDRIRSEGEIRLAGGLLIPLASITISYTICATKFQMVLSFFVGFMFAIFIVNYGLYYYKKANSFLAHHIADGKVLAPSMESLKRNSNKTQETGKEYKVDGKISLNLK
ncbi:MAG: hypothetical protein IM638_05775 [Bacteroidetes bacterium]|nr:hypothetical protein [Bacteroidota bacterium]